MFFTAVTLLVSYTIMYGANATNTQKGLLIENAPLMVSSKFYPPFNPYICTPFNDSCWNNLLINGVHEGFDFGLICESWDCVATVFFIDTAHNIIAYIERIYKILKPGGYWVNLDKGILTCCSNSEIREGPLLYHYSDVPNEMSIELSYEDVKSVIKKVRFEFEKEEQNIKSSYTQNPKSMLHYSYDSAFFVVKKPS